MKTQPRLGSIELVHQVTDALLPSAQPLDEGYPCLV